jgi:hypothetical protein
MERTFFFMPLMAISFQMNMPLSLMGYLASSRYAGDQGNEIHQTAFLISGIFHIEAIFINVPWN